MFLPHQDKRGYLDVVLSLLDVKDHALYERIPQMVEPHVSKALQEHVGTVENYRTCVPFGDKAVDLAWQGQLAHYPQTAFHLRRTHSLRERVREGAQTTCREQAVRQ